MKELNESGRSMVEMLGVLAIIGVLSVGGIAGYTQAMRKYRANNLIDCASKFSVAQQVSTTAVSATDWCSNNMGGCSIQNKGADLSGMNLEITNWDSSNTCDNQVKTLATQMWTNTDVQLS